MTNKEILHVAEIIRKQVSWFNGWQVSQDTIEKNCDMAANKIAKYLKKTRQSQSQKVEK